MPSRSAVPPDARGLLHSTRPRRPAGIHSPAGPMGTAVFVSSARPVASGAVISSGQLTIRGCIPTEGLAVALYLDRAPWRAPVVVPVPADGVVKLPPEVRDAGPLRVLLRAEDPAAPVNWPDWPGRDAFACAAPGLPVSSDMEEDSLSRFLAGERDLPVRPRRVEHLWRLLHLAGDLIAGGAPADLRERCSAALATQPSLALTGLLDSGLDAAACVAGLIRTGLAAARPVMMDDMRAAERLWDLVPAAAAVLCSRLLAGPDYPDEDPAAIVLEAARAQCGPTLDAVLRGHEDPHAQAAVPSVVPQPLLDAATRAAAATQLSADVFRTPALARATQDAATVVSSAGHLLAASPYRHAAAHIATRNAPGGLGALPAMSASLALVARIAARGDEACRSFERSWRCRWTDLAWQAPALTGIDLVLAEARLAAAERARFGLGSGAYRAHSGVSLGTRPEPAGEGLSLGRGPRFAAGGVNVSPAGGAVTDPASPKPPNLTWVFRTVWPPAFVASSCLTLVPPAPAPTLTRRNLAPQWGGGLTCPWSPTPHEFQDSLHDHEDFGTDSRTQPFAIMKEAAGEKWLAR